MTYAQVNEANEVTTIAGRLPNAARRLDSRAWVLGFPQASPDVQAACGWFPVVDVARPADDDVNTHDRTIEMVGDPGQPTVVWTQRPWTPDELAARQATANASTIDAAISAALAELQQLVDAPAIPDVPAGTMTTAQLSNVLRSMRDVIQQNRAGIQRVAGTLKQTIRLVRGDFEGTD